MKNLIYGYCRISTVKQSIERQERNILKEYPTAKIYKETFTGTKTTGRKELEKILQIVTNGDTIVFDSVSRMSRNAEEGFQLYMKLYHEGINLVFLKEHYIDTDVYRQATEQGLTLTGTDVDCILEGVNRYMIKLAEKQIKIAFEQAQKEVDDLHQRTAEGIQTARLQGKQIGAKQGVKFNVKKAAQAKKIILKHSKAFGGSLSDKEVQALANISRNSYYKYKKELQSEGR